MEQNDVGKGTRQRRAVVKLIGCEFYIRLRGLGETAQPLWSLLHEINAVSSLAKHDIGLGCTEDSPR